MLAVPGRRALFTGDHDAFRDSARRFVAAEVAGALKEWRCAQTTPRAVVSAAGDAGFLGITAPEEFGGAALSDLGFLTVLIEETVAVGATGLALLWALHSGVAMTAVAGHGTPVARRRWLPGLVSGAAVGIPTPTGAVSLHGDLLSGKLVNVPHGGIADLLIVTITGGPRAGGAVLVATEQPRVIVHDVVGNLATPEAGLADITLDRVPIDADDVIGEARALRPGLNVWFSVVAAAAARYAFTLAVDYTQERKVFGRPLAEFENTRLRLAELAAGLSATTSFVDSCLGGQDGIAAADAAAAHVLAGRLHDQCVDQALQLHGGYGYMREYPISQAYADARFLRLLAQQYTDIDRTIADDLGL